ncbi:MAG TPA: CRISPR-associated protein [Bacillota bacterium]|nr:CRISPR-associated protein [Bacillota bacterium]
MVCMDTFLRKATGEIPKAILEEDGFPTVICHVASGLRTSSTMEFSEGTKKLIHWCYTTLPHLSSSGYKVIFSLSGGFKALHGYMNLIGMLQSDEIVYIFEGTRSQLIRIPHLPIELNDDYFEKHAVQICMLATGQYSCSSMDLPGIPDVFVDKEGDGLKLSAWGSLVWNEMKTRILSSRLLKFPRMEYTTSFVDDYREADEGSRVRLQETLAKVAVLLVNSDGDTAPLKVDGGLRYGNYEARFHDGKPVGHFRVSKGLRVSCQKTNSGKLKLYRFGREEDVNRNPTP